jgi:hypothetical protein
MYFDFFLIIFTAMMSCWVTSIVSDYGLDDQASRIWSPRETEDFFLASWVQTSSEAHPASYPMGTGGKVQLGRDTDPSPRSSAEVKNE